MAMFDQLHDSGQTIILVTHEEYIAAHAQRIIRLRDGKIESDVTTDRFPPAVGLAGRVLQSAQEVTP